MCYLTTYCLFTQLLPLSALESDIKKNVKCINNCIILIKANIFTDLDKKYLLLECENTINVCCYLQCTAVVRFFVEIHNRQVYAHIKMRITFTLSVILTKPDTIKFTFFLSATTTVQVQKFCFANQNQSSNGSSSKAAAGRFSNRCRSEMSVVMFIFKTPAKSHVSIIYAPLT